MGLVAIGLGFTACNNDDIDMPNQEKGNTHVSVSLKLTSSSLKSAVESNDEDFNYVGKWGGQDDITTVTIYLVDPSNGSVARYPFSVGEVGSGTAYEKETDGQGNTILRPTNDAAFKTTAGEKTVWVVVNENTVVQNHLAAGGTSAAGFAAQYQTIGLALTSETPAFDPAPVTPGSKLASVQGTGDDARDIIVMTNVAPETKTVVANVTEENTIVDAENRFSLQVERAVSRVLITHKVTDYTIEGALGVIIGTISDVKWVLGQGENSLYVERGKTPWDWATPNWDYVPVTDEDYWNQAGDIYDYSGLYEGYVVAPGFGGNEVTASPAISGEGIGVASIANGRFILPTTHLYGAPGDPYTGGYRRGNTAYVLVRAQFTPSDEAYADGTTGYTGGDDFYVGGNGRFYSSAANAVNPETGGLAGQTVAKYVGGKVLYYAWINPDNVNVPDQNWYNSPVLRNNIYHIDITGFKTLGTNWNPLFPEEPVDPFLPNDEYDPTDPTKPWIPGTNEPVIPNPEFEPDEPVGPGNQPYVPNPEYDPDEPTVPGENSPFTPNPEYDPKNPDPKPWVPGVEEPTNPIDPTDPLTTPETWMSVDVTVLPWLVHSYEVDLGI